MTIQRTFFDWARSGLDWSRDPWEDMAPNLLAIHRWLHSNYGGQPLGLDDFNREIRSGGTISDHAYGAALDWRHGPNWLPGTNPDEIPRARALEIIDHIIDWSAELHVHRIHDYVGDRIWTAGRTNDVADAHGSWWKPQNGAGSGMGESWARYFHIATHHDGYFDATEVAARGVPLVGAQPQPTDPEEDDDMALTPEQAAQLEALAKDVAEIKTALAKLPTEVWKELLLVQGRKEGDPPEYREARNMLGWTSKNVEQINKRI